MRDRARAALAIAAAAALVGAPAVGAQDDAPRRVDSGRFTIVHFPRDETLARALMAAAVGTDSFPWLPRPRQRVLIALAPDAARFRAWVGPAAPEWGIAVAFPESRRVIMQGRTAGSDAGDPVEVLRHELAHLALHERLGDLPPRWFDEGYASLAAREWRREDVLAANVALAFRGAPTLARLEEELQGGAVAAQSAYALSYRAVVELAALDRDRGLTLFFEHWRESRSLDQAMRRAFGTTMAGFEARYRAATRRRYGALALVADLSIVLLVVTVLVLPFFVARRLRDRRRLRTLVAADLAAERAERDRILAALLAAPPPGDPGDGPDRPGRDAPTLRPD